MVLESSGPALANVGFTPLAAMTQVVSTLPSIRHIRVMVTLHL